MIVMPSTNGFHLSRLKHEARRLAGRATFLYDQASANKLVLRLTFNFDTKLTLSAVWTRIAQSPAFVPDLDNGAGPVSLPPDVRLRDVTVEGTGNGLARTVSAFFIPRVMSTRPWSICATSRAPCLRSLFSP